MKKISILLAFCLMSLSLWAAVGDGFTVGGINYKVTSLSPATVEIGDNTGTDFSAAPDVVIPDTVTNAGVTYAVTKIGQNSFDYNKTITSVTIPESVTTIGANAFKNCQNLTSVFCLPSNPPTMGSAAFDNCSDDLAINVPEGSETAYKAAKKWSDYASKITSTVVQVTLPASGKATFSTLADVVIPSGVTAYYAASVNNNSVHMEAITGKIPANTGVVLIGTAGTAYDFALTSAAAAITGTNLLKPTDGVTEVAAGKYVLSGGEFHPLSAAYAVAAGKAYLDYSSPEAKLHLDFSDANGIGNVESRTADALGGKLLENGRVVIMKNGVKYNLAGQAVK